MEKCVLLNITFREKKIVNIFLLVCISLRQPYALQLTSIEEYYT